jgi:hypothetical protein
MMIHAVVGILWSSLTVGLGGLDDAPSKRAGVQADEPAQFHDRMHQTFVLLNHVVLPAYLDHFRDESDKLAVVHYYAGRLAWNEDDMDRSADHFRQCFLLAEPDSYYSFYACNWLRDPDLERRVASVEEGRRIDETWKRLYDRYWGAGPQSWVRAANSTVGKTDSPQRADSARLFLNHLGNHPHIVLQRGMPVVTPDQKPEEWKLVESVARCPLYDPQLLSIHTRVAAREAGATTSVEPLDLPQELARSQLAVRALREQPEDRELSLRKFLDRHRTAIWRLGWLHRSTGLQQERSGDSAAARESYMRAWAIGDSLFPVSDRGRLDRFDRVFLAELGDVYARLGRYDLMLRYMYSDSGLPAQFDMARPVAELARVAESVRLARHDESAGEQLDEVLPETVSQILFEQPVMPAATAVERRSADSSNWAVRTGWMLIGVGGVVLLVAVATRLIRTKRRTAFERAAKSVSPLVNSAD